MERAKTPPLTFKVRDLDGREGQGWQKDGFPMLPELNAGQGWSWWEDPKRGPGGPGQGVSAETESWCWGWRRQGGAGSERGSPCLGWLGKPGSHASQERALAGWNPSRPSCELSWPLGDTMLWPSCLRCSFKTAFLMSVSSTLPGSLLIWHSRWSWETTPNPYSQHTLICPSIQPVPRHHPWGLTWIISLGGPWAQHTTPHQENTFLPHHPNLLQPPETLRTVNTSYSSLTLRGCITPPLLLPPKKSFIAPRCYFRSLPHPLPLLTTTCSLPKGSWPTSGSGFSLS